MTTRREAIENALTDYQIEAGLLDAEFNAIVDHVERALVEWELGQSPSDAEIEAAARYR